MNRRSPLTLVAIFGVFALTACGSRVSDALRQQAAAAALGQGGNGGTNQSLNGGGTTSGGTTGAQTSGGTTGGTTGAGTTTGGTTSGGTTTTTGGGSTGGTTGPVDNGGATDVGVSATSIKLGVVADLSGPIPGLFQGAKNGVQAYITKINTQGGIYGRQLSLDVLDSQLTCGQYKSSMEQAIAGDFAAVGSFALYDSCGVDPLHAHPGFSDIHSALSGDAQKVANNFSVAPLGLGWRTGPLAYYKNKWPDKFGHIGTVYAGVGGGATSWDGVEKTIDFLGGSVVYKRGYQPTETDFTADIVNMERSGVQMVYLASTDSATDANFLKALRSQSLSWPVVYGASAYDTAFLQKAGSQAEGVFEDQQYSLFFNASDAAVIPAVKDFQTWYGRVTGGAKPDLFAAYGWASAQLFVQALKAAGPKALRSTLLAELKKVHRFDADGILAAADPAGKKPATCWLFTTVKNGEWTRLDSPPSTFRCDGSYHYTG